MTIEKKGPGAVGNSYGTRETVKPSKIGTAGMVNPIYEAFQNQALVPEAGRVKRGQFGGVQNFLRMDDLSEWDERAGTGATFAIDSDVLYDGKPTIRITIPAGQTTARIGTSLATARMPYNWDKTRFAVATRCSNIAAFAGPNLFIATAAGFVTDYLSWGQGVGSYDQSTRDNEWLVWMPEKDFTNSVGFQTTGVYTATATKRLRLSVNLSAAQATDTHVWIGCFGVMRKRPKPTIVMTYDDGLASIFTHAYPLLKAHGLPLSTAMVTSAIDTPGYMTRAQVLEMEADPSGRFEAVTHGFNHDNVNALGSAAYVADVIRGREDLRSWGITGDGPNHHPWITSVYTNEAIDGLKAAGFLSARAAGLAYPGRSCEDSQIRAGDKRRWLMNSFTTLGNTKNAAQMIAEIQAWLPIGGFACLMGHAFAPTSSNAYTMSFADHTQLISYVASLRDAGTVDVMSWTEWYDTYCT